MAKYRNNNHRFLFSNEVYDAFKHFTQVGLPAAGALYFGLAQIWGFPNAEQVVGTVAVVNTFFGVVLVGAQRSYDKSDAKYDGVVPVSEDEDGLHIGPMQLTKLEDPRDIAKMSEVRFKVEK